MNNKGFTLVELLATVVILGLVMGFGIYGTVGTINKSKVRAEKIFVSRLSKVVDEYIDLNRSSYVEGSSTSFSKCNNGSCVNSVAKALKKSNGGSIYIQDLIEEKFLSKEDVTENTIIVDIGINFDECGKLCGDANKECYDVVKAYSPVPGGVGVMTNVVLMENLLKSYKKNH